MQIITDLKGNIDKNIIVVGNFNISLSRMDNLKTLVIYGDLSMIELPTTSCERITTVEIHDESDLDNNEQLERLKTIFPNAKITLEKDDR